MIPLKLFPLYTRVFIFSGIQWMVLKFKWDFYKYVIWLFTYSAKWWVHRYRCTHPEVAKLGTERAFSHCKFSLCIRNWWTFTDLHPLSCFWFSAAFCKFLDGKIACHSVNVRAWTNDKCLATKHHQTVFGDQTFYRLDTLFGAVWSCLYVFDRVW